jgi:hypothetical protein
MRFYTKQQSFSWDIDRHARIPYVYMLHQDGAVVVHRHMPTSPTALLKIIATYRASIIMAVACLFPGYCLADLCAREGMPFVLGPVLSMQAIHGGKANNAQIDAPTIAGLLPQADVYPAERRATRALRRRPLMRKRAERLPHGQHTNGQYHGPELGKKLAYKANRTGVAERFPADGNEASTRCQRRTTLSLNRSGKNWQSRS